MQKSKDCLRVSSLDDISNPCFGKKHSNKANKNWVKNKKLFSQPLKGQKV